MSKYELLQKKFEQKADSQKGQEMAAYMRNRFVFYGFQAKERKALYHDLIKEEKKQQVIDWELLHQAWADPHREMQYFVCDYLIALEKYLTFDDLIEIEKFVRSKQWWDTIDALIKPIGYLGLKDDRIDQVMLQWSQDPDFWVRRVAIEHQLLRKEKTKLALLQTILENNLDSSEFFINKAIGWALRDYSKTDPDWVRKFIAEHRDHLAKLSIKEGSKYLPK